jgi:hypothetical protein
MREALTLPRDDAARARLAAWAGENVSLAAVARRGVEVIAGVLAARRRGSRPE